MSLFLRAARGAFRDVQALEHLPRQGERHPCLQKNPQVLKKTLLNKPGFLPLKMAAKNGYYCR